MLGPLGLLSPYQCALLVDFIKIFEMFAENTNYAPAFKSFITRLVRGAVTDHALAVYQDADHAGQLHGFSQWARALYPVRPHHGHVNLYLISF